MSNLRYPNQAGPFREDVFSYRHDRDSSMGLIESLRIPWHPEKTGKVFTSVFVFIGFLWDLPHRRVSLPDSKRLKYLFRVNTMITRINSHDTFTLVELQEIHGCLIHVCFIHSDGSSRLPPLSNSMSTYRGNEHIRRHLSDSVKKTLLWWKRRLEDPIYFRQLRQLKPLTDLGIFVDASTDWGIGILFGGKWWTLQLRPDWKIEGQDICWLEAIAIELALYFVVSEGFSDTHLLISSDNQGAIGALKKGRSRNSAINLCVRRTTALLSSHFIIPSLRYIESNKNPADPLSRGILGPPSLRMTRSFSLPSDISPFFLKDVG